MSYLIALIILFNNRVAPHAVVTCADITGYDDDSAYSDAPQTADSRGRIILEATLPFETDCEVDYKGHVWVGRVKWDSTHKTFTVRMN